MQHQVTDLLDYLLEYTPSCWRGKVLTQGLDEATALRFRAVIEDSAVVLFTKPGCGFCEKARAIATREAAGGDFDVALVTASPSGDAAMHVALRAALARPGPPTYPAIVVRGVYIGGCDDLERLIADGALADRARASHAPYAGLPARLPYDAILDRPFDARRDARGASACRFQTGAHANAIRAYALFYVVLQLLTAALASDALAVAMVVDAMLFVLFGPTPFSPVGLLAARVTWSVRGGVVPSLPYKFIWALYAATGVACVHRDRALRPAMYAAAFNSGLLAAFRF